MFLRTLAIALLVSPMAQAFQVGISTAKRAKSVALLLKAHHADEGQDDDGRRAFMATGMTAAASWMLPPMPAHAVDGGVDYKAVAQDVMKLVEKNPDWGPSKYFFIFLTGCVLAIKKNSVHLGLGFPQYIF